MTKKIDVEKMETMVLKEISSRPTRDMYGNKIYCVKEEYEEVFVKNLNGCKEVKNLRELEDAVNSPKAKYIFIGASASVTVKGMETVLSRTALTKQIFCSFDIK